MEVVTTFYTVELVSLQHHNCSLRPSLYKRSRKSQSASVSLVICLSVCQHILRFCIV